MEGSENPYPTFEEKSVVAMTTQWEINLKIRVLKISLSEMLA